MLGKLFEKLTGPKKSEEELGEEFYTLKTMYMESVLGPEHELVQHAIIPYAVGGGLDLYYYPNHIEGVGIATKELVHYNGSNARNDMFPGYEWVMFTRQPLDMDSIQDVTSAFGKTHKHMNGILNAMARYAEQAKLNPNETCEFPPEFGDLGGVCLLVDNYTAKNNVGPNNMGLMLIIQIHRSEMEFARANSGADLIQKLKHAGHYPYSDMDREAVA